LAYDVGDFVEFHHGVEMTDSVGNGENPQQAEYLKHLYRGSELLLNDKIVEAREALEEASRIDPDDPKCLSLLGLVYFRLDEFEPAQQIYELLVQHFPEEASLRVNLGLVYMKQGHADRAFEQMNRGVAIDPEHQRAYGYLGLLHSERGEHQQAREAFRKAGQEAMVQKMDEVIAAESAGETPVTPELTADALPPDPNPFGNPTGELEPVPAPGSPPPVAPAAPAEQMQPLTSDGQTLPVEAPPLTAAQELPAEAPVAAEPAPAPEVVQFTSPEAVAPEAVAPEAVAPEAAPLAGDADPGSSFDDEIDAVIDGAVVPRDEAVAPREPWPGESGVLPPVVPPAEAPEAAAPSAQLSAAEPAPSPPPGGRGADSVPIFAYATEGLVDLSARTVRMLVPQPNTLIFPVQEDGFIRAEALTAHVGEISFEDAHRRAKGQFTDEPMVDSRGRFVKVLGDGVLLCDAGDEQVTVLDLFDDFMYLRMEYLFAFESTLHWENGKVRGATGPIELIHIRGEGRLALVGADKLRKVRLVPDREAYVSEESLVGWMGRVSPQTLPQGAAEHPESAFKPMMRCVGEGVLLLRSAERSAELPAAAARED
jgi:uncharacterized protein (AIM24 family)